MEIDIVQLSTAIVTTLVPFTPILIKMAQFSAEAIGEMVVQKGGEAAWQKAKSIWGKITSRFGDDKVIEGAAMMVAGQPANEEFQKMLAVQLASRLQQHPDLAKELIELLGGQDAVQKVIADRSSWVEDVTQEMSGSGSQIVQASDDSVIKGVRQIKK